MTTTAPKQPVVPDTDTIDTDTDIDTTDTDIDTTLPKQPVEPDQDTITVPDDAQKPPESEITKPKDDENTADEIDKLPVAPVTTIKKKPTVKHTVKTTTKTTKKTPRVGAGLIGDFGNKKKSPPNILPYIPPPPQDDPLDLGKWKRYK